MTTLIVLSCIALLLIIIVQVSRVRELSKQLRGTEEVERKATNTTGIGLVAFMVLFLIGTTLSAFLYKNYILGYGPHESASEHGVLIDNMMHITLLVTYSVFVLTHILLFWYAYKFRQQKGRKAQYISHNNTLEVVWTGIPAIVMTFLVVGGLDAWNDIMGDVGADDNYLEIEAMGYQFAWQMRYPGPDGLLGRRDFRLINPTNQMGIDWNDPKSHDDVLLNNFVLPVDQKVRVRITAKDVLHDFYLPQFRVKMDAVPGLPTYFVFTPKQTTKEYRKKLSQYEEYQVPDPDDPEKMYWETANYELACAELCGIGHWSMQRTFAIVEQDEYDAWVTEQSSYYMENIRGTENDPLADQLLGVEIEQRSQQFMTDASTALRTPDDTDNTLKLEYVTYETGSARLTEMSRYQLDDVVTFLKRNTGVQARISGHTDNVGDAEMNMNLSDQRAASVRSYLTTNGIDAARLTSIGYGQTRPVETNETEEGRQANRRTELYITNTTVLTDEQEDELSE